MARQDFHRCETAQQWVGSWSAFCLVHGRAPNIAAGLPLYGGAPSGGADQIGSERSRRVPSVMIRSRSSSVRRLRSRRRSCMACMATRCTSGSCTAASIRRTAGSELPASG